jgi:hypothetical protein
MVQRASRRKNKFSEPALGEARLEITLRKIARLKVIRMLYTNPSMERLCRVSPIINPPSIHRPRARDIAK